MRIISYIFLLLIVVIGVSFATLNSQAVTINYFIGHRLMPLSLLLVMVFAIGCVLGLLVLGGSLISAKVHNRHLRKQLLVTEKEVENLRAIPLKDKH